MTKLMWLFAEYGQSSWLDNLTRAYLRDGTLARYIADGVRGVTANPAIFARAIDGRRSMTSSSRRSSAPVLASLTPTGSSSSTTCAALGLLQPVYDENRGRDGFASIEVAPELAHDTAASVAAARGAA